MNQPTKPACNKCGKDAEGGSTGGDPICWDCYTLSPVIKDSLTTPSSSPSSADRDETSVVSYDNLLDQAQQVQRALESQLSLANSQLEELREQVKQEIHAKKLYENVCSDFRRNQSKLNSQLEVAKKALEKIQNQGEFIPSHVAHEALSKLSEGGGEKV